jgi:Secretion system C-terminal sorting domain
MAFIQSHCFAQTAVNTFSIVTSNVVSGGTSSQTITSHANSVNTITPSTNYTVKYNNTGNVSITDFTLSGKTYVKFSSFDTVFIRRVANAWIPSTGNKQHIYCEGPATVDNTTHIINFPVAYPVVTANAYMERVMKQGYINRGSDNLFNNDSTSDLTYNNIERVDFVYKTGMATSTPASAGFLIAERGGNDAFKIAAVKTIDANGNPTSFGSVLSVGTGTYGAAIYSAATYVMRKDITDNVLRPFSLVPSQGVKAVFIKFSDLGITAGQNVYGYALMASDVTATTSAQLLSYTNNTYFPQNTTTANGGMDLSSAPGIFHTDQVLAGHYLNLSAQNKNCEQLLQWTDDDYMQVKEYQVEKSTDRLNFEKIAVVNGMGSPIKSFTDKNFTASCYYRIKAELPDGDHYYSSVIFANNTCSSEKITLYPNPVKDMLTITSSSLVHFDQVSIVSVEGKEFEGLSVPGSNLMIKLDLSALPKGHYFIRLNEAGKEQKAYPFLKL